MHNIDVQVTLAPPGWQMVYEMEGVILPAGTLLGWRFSTRVESKGTGKLITATKPIGIDGCAERHCRGVMAPDGSVLLAGHGEFSNIAEANFALGTGAKFDASGRYRGKE